MIYTCLVTRNIHLEVVPDNTTYQFVLAIRRFFARRGTPRRVVLDNARTVKLGERIFDGDIKQMCEDDEFFTAFLDSQPIEWNFITPLSPWKGGFYERLIAIVKKLLYASEVCLMDTSSRCKLGNAVVQGKLDTTVRHSSQNPLFATVVSDTREEEASRRPSKPAEVQTKTY
uniref:Integrase catalytic domain-containing protein n=1 Tax=Caenorhabditis japonica TaxID=281687 RepID=A0A8R1HUU2_CAEJA